jgi:hypothetical protein
LSDERGIGSVSFIYEVQGLGAKEKLQQAIDSLTIKNPILRTTILRAGKQIYQVLLTERQTSILLENTSSGSMCSMLTLGFSVTVTQLRITLSFKMTINAISYSQLATPFSMPFPDKLVTRSVAIPPSSYTLPKGR